MFIYAQVESGKCIALLQSSRAVSAANMIAIASYDLSYLGKNYSAGVWS
jgi:hypothetical protein